MLFILHSLILPLYDYKWGWASLHLLNLISLFCELSLLPFSGKKFLESVFVEFLYILEMNPFLAVGTVNTFSQYVTCLMTVYGDFH